MSGREPRSASRAAPSLGAAKWLKRASTQAVLGAFEEAGHQARIVGGAVRNALLGRPVRDIDVATPADPQRVIEIVEQAGLKAVPTGLKHGTVTVIAAGQPFEVTTLREDVETFGRHAEVRFTTKWEADASRRDFTINALYCDRDGNVFDPLNGYGDLEAHIVRFIGEPTARIREDYLRILRFFRFFGEYASGEIDQAGLAASVAERGSLRQLSGERLRQELVKLLIAPRALDAMQALFEYGLIGEILPVAPRLNRLARLCAIDDGTSAIVRLGVTAVGVREDAERIADRLRLSNAQRDLLGTIAAAARVEAVPDLAEAKRWLYEMGEDRYRASVAVARSQSFEHMSNPAWIDALALPEQWSAPKFPMTGARALELGGRPGPALGAALKQTEERWMESGFALSESELEAILAETLRTAADQSG